MVRRSKLPDVKNSGPEPLSLEQWEASLAPFELSGRQARIVAMILQGKNDKQIALELGLSKHTVRTYLNRVFQRFTVTSRLGLILHLLASGPLWCPYEKCPYKV